MAINTVRLKGLALIIFIETFCASAAGADTNVPPLQFGIFGTVGAVYHEARGIEYRRFVDQTSAARSGQLEFGTDSALGGQITAHATEQLDVMVQAVSRLRSDNSWDPQINWAFARYTPDDGMVVRLGRVGLDTQLDSESRLIGYSNLPIRPSHELLLTVQTDFLDGGDVTLRRPLGEGIGRIKVFYGDVKSKINISGGEFASGRSTIAGLSLGYEQGNWQGRVQGGYGKVHNNGDGQQLVDALRAVPAPFATQAQATADALDNRGEHVYFLGMDLAYESGPAKLQASYLMQSAREQKVLLSDARALAIMVGYRIREVTPYFNYGRLIRDAVSFSSGLPASPGLSELDRAANAAVAASQGDQRSVGLGARFDFAQHFAAKFQVDRVRAGYSQAILDPSRPANARKHVTLFSATLDFAF